MLVWSMRCGSVLLLGLIGIEGTRVFRKNCSVATIRFAETKNSDFCATFLRLRTPFRPPRGGNGPLCVRFAAFPGVNPRFDASRQFAIAKKLQFWAYFCFWAPGSASCWCHGRGGLGAAPLLMTLGSVVGGAGSAARCGDASGGATWAAGCLGQRDAVNGVGLA